MDLLLYILGIVLMLLGGLILVGNYLRQITHIRNRNNPDAGWSSPAPLVAPLLITIGYAILPIAFSGWIWIVFVLDPDTVLTVMSLPWLFKSFRE